MMMMIMLIILGSTSRSSKQISCWWFERHKHGQSGNSWPWQERSTQHAQLRRPWIQ